MQPSFDLNLLKTNKINNARKLFAEVEAAQILKEDAKAGEKARSFLGVWLGVFRRPLAPSTYTTSEQN